MNTKEVIKIGFLINTTRSEIFKEMNDQQRKEYFNLTRNKYIPNIDTFYYSCFLEEDNSNGKVPSNILELLELLRECKRVREQLNEDFWFNIDRELLFTGKRNKIYSYCISKRGQYDIFIADALPNNKTPRIHIQLRSLALWTRGVHKVILEAYDDLKSILEDYNIKVFKVQENRIDYCYHTNSIQSPEKLYNDNTLINNCKTSFNIYNKVGRLFDKELTVEYLSLGSRKSNNVFFRSYNKTREVIEENYKEFFLDVWLSYGIINEYDYFVYRYAYNKKSYDQIYNGMMYFYTLHGKNKTLAAKYKKMLDNINTNIDDVRKAVKGVLPLPTKVVNIEFQTMRKFYYSGIDVIEKLPITYDLKEPVLLELYQIIDNRKIFLDYLTSNCVAFVKTKNTKNIEYMDFWKRLRGCKLDITCKCIYKRKYDKNINIELMERKIKSNLATLSIYKGNFETDINDDMSNLISILNDNDMKINSDGSCSIIDNEYKKIKAKKIKALRSIVKSNANIRPL